MISYRFIVHKQRSILINTVFQIMSHLWTLGYAAEDIISTIFRGAKQLKVSEELILEFVKEIGLTHLRIIEGSNSLLQMSALLARLCLVSTKTT